MAKRPVFVSKLSYPYYSVEEMEFEWNGGFAKVQKQKNIKGLHEEFNRIFPEKKVLEISSKSMQDQGENLSAFFLQKYVPSLGKSCPVECVFQAGKTFTNGGPYLDLLNLSPRDAKRDERLNNSGVLRCFTFEGQEFPLIPRTVFYDYIYINALFENPTQMETLMQYDAFTDIEFNPDRSINCQAKAAATFVSLKKLGLLDEIHSFDRFRALFNLSEPKRVKPIMSTSMMVKPVSGVKAKKGDT